MNLGASSVRMGRQLQDERSERRRVCDTQTNREGNREGHAERPVAQLQSKEKNFVRLSHSTIVCSRMSSLSSLLPSTTTNPLSVAVGAAVVLVGGAVFFHRRRSTDVKEQTTWGPDDTQVSAPLVTLCRFDPQAGQPYGDKSVSPFSLKVETFLRLARIPYRNEAATVKSIFRNPKRKLPAATIKGDYVADSSFIIRHLQMTAPFSQSCQANLCDAELTPQQKAVGYFIKQTCEEHLYFVIGYWRYMWKVGYKGIVHGLAVVLKCGSRARVCACVSRYFCLLLFWFSVHRRASTSI